jgi:histidinol dehydrogenase
MQALSSQMDKLPRKDIVRHALQNSRIIVLPSDTDILDFINAYAPEHLIIQTANYQRLADGIRNAGSVFLGAFTPESAGDYASGTNHTLPTNGHARAYGGLCLDSFTRKLTFQEITPDGLQRLGSTICAMAEGENLQAHSNAVTVRLSE